MATVACNFGSFFYVGILPKILPDLNPSENQHGTTYIYIYHAILGQGPCASRAPLFSEALEEGYGFWDREHLRHRKVHWTLQVREFAALWANCASIKGPTGEKRQPVGAEARPILFDILGREMGR